MARDIKKIVSQMTLEEKAGLCSGLDNWHTKPVERLGIPSIMVSDGPHGLRKQGKEAEHLGPNASLPATCFPSGAAMACGWDRKLLEKVGEALGKECQAQHVDILLGPAVNIKRSPLCGRNFEYYSEDPYLSSEIATSYIKGVQSQGVGTSLKHFAANNQEHRRMIIDAVMDERTLREVYLANFEGAVRQSKPWTIMAAYNKVNGDFCTENKALLTDILREEWGFDGFVVSDWGAVDHRAAALEAGLELEMPANGGIGDGQIIDAVKSGKLSEGVLDQAVERLLNIIFKAVDSRKENEIFPKEEHHQLAREVARECMVLLKNEDNLLPLKKEGAIAVIGALAKHPRFQGGGSSHINPTMVENIYDELAKAAGSGTKITWAEGYRADSDDIDADLLDEAKKAAAKSDAAVIFAGLPDRYESEGFDRKHLSIPENHRQLIEAVAEVQSNVVVVLSNGSPIEMPWIDKVKGVLDAYLGGQALGGAIADLLFGDANPCGKLAETFPVKLGHNPSHVNFPGEEDRVEYREGLFVGYRHYDATEIEPLFPFGHGLSYTEFQYTGISIDKKEITDTDTLTVNVKVKNTGKRAGKEIVQLYVRDVKSSVIRPYKELKGFEKVELQPGEERSIAFTLGKRAFAYYSPEIKDWYVESGDFEILVGKSSKDIILKETVNVKSSVPINKKLCRNSAIGDLMAHPVGSVVGKQALKDFLVKFSKLVDSLDMDVMATVEFMPLRSIVSFSEGEFTEEMLENLINQINEGA